MTAITNFGKSAFRRVRGVKKPEGCGQEVEDKQVERASSDLRFKMKT